ncbi:insulinase family protein [Patescibacteria group bacterium]|nr:MAG: insulinase family protein [Patescibacteria group bacterium]
MRYKKKTLPNGLRIVTIPIKGSPTVTVLVLVEAGSKYETKNLSGLSHFLEHVSSKGTKKRPRSIDISKELDGLGAENNAFTSFELTGYYAKAHPRHTKKLIEIISDMYINPTFPAGELEKEKGVIIEEINLNEDTPARNVGRVFMRLLYGEQPAGWSVLGTKKVIRKIERGDFLAYRKKHYLAKATAVVVAGDINEQKVRDWVTRAFAEIPEGPKQGKKKVIEHQVKPALALKFKKTDQVHMIVGVRTFPTTDRRTPALELLNAILGRGMSCRLFQKLREEMAVCYYVRSHVSDFTDHGYLAVSCGVDSKRIEKSVRAILEEFRKLCRERVSAEELGKAKEYLIGNMYMDVESSDEVAEFFGLQEILKRRIEAPREIERKIRKVKAGDIQKLARTIFQNRKLNLALIGNVRSAASLRKIFYL